MVVCCRISFCRLTAATILGWQCPTLTVTIPPSPIDPGTPPEPGLLRITGTPSLGLGLLRVAGAEGQFAREGIGARFVPADDEADGAPAGAELSFALRGRSDGAAFDPDLPAVRLARAAVEEATGMPCAVTRSGGAIPLVTALAGKGVPTVLTGCALPNDRIHAPDEHLRVEQYALGVEMARAILTAFGGLGDGAA